MTGVFAGQGLDGGGDELWTNYVLDYAALCTASGLAP